ncbi:hypothetical protein ASD99_08460 [Mesorhizobium sp. Root695]|uniref:MobA/MobL family protein n=1 Tax=Mesorhizobium sp. Root695 TaxID=1736589 RepID=UPI000710CC30|nr:MobA/MobL family protein [Mesorhizobium sp. Root695]KRB16389.1 hypothetical protein ASD99_08460 [Mesorhizobium sp. Root695]
MADFFRTQLGIVSRAEGHSAAKRSAYQACGKLVGHDGQAFNFTRKASEHFQTIMLMPQGAPDWTREPQSLWQRAAAAEKRVDAQEARIVDFSMPRAVPTELWEGCVRYVYHPFVAKGMVLQVDIHDSPASDGGRNINVHGLGTLREIDGDGFSKRKNRSWNDLFRERGGRAVREQFAERLTGFCRDHGIDYDGDARPNGERDLPDAEPDLPKWNFEAFGRTGQMPEALAALQDHRARRREWETARAEEIAAALDLAKVEARIRERRQRRLCPAEPARAKSGSRDRRAAILRAWHQGGWIDATTIPAIETVRFDEQRGLLWIDMKDGSTLIDRGDSVALRGRLTWSAAVETAAAADRHGWSEVNVYGDQAYKDAVSVAAMLRGVTVLNHELSSKARAELHRLLAIRAVEVAANSRPQQGQEADYRCESDLRQRSSREIHRELTKQAFVEGAPPAANPDAENTAPVLKPPYLKST